ncbi:uncharacterized protein LOC107721997 [Sinocyclocheilus rhinocerous]|uniref:uncharacterized protein LOC107721997 n=1 Tax=Sinocyclocheilus rhinocerous TaxID=307959 RepID=UPI0007B8737D|nr:PREDICTED: uncharacterized protein LOC107721997 [Sinocyclocheilus rhinocerous]
MTTHSLVSTPHDLQAPTTLQTSLRIVGHQIPLVGGVEGEMVSPCRVSSSPCALVSSSLEKGRWENMAVKSGPAGVVAQDSPSVALVTVCEVVEAVGTLAGGKPGVDEEATSCEDHQTSAQTHPHFSREVSLNISELLKHEKFGVSNNPEASVCTNILSQTCQHQGQGKCNNTTRKDSIGEYLVNSPSQETSQKETSSPKYSNQTCSHLLVHPVKENTTQNEFQKETQTKGTMSYWIYSKGNQVQTSKHKMSGTTLSASVLQNNCGASKTKMVDASIASSSSAGASSCNASHQMSSQELHTHQICPPAIHSNPTYLGNNSYLEHEDSNSSSDDEQKLVIELE